MSYKLKPEHVQILRNIEENINKHIPQLNEISYDILGVKIEDNNIIGISLYKCGLTTIPESISHLSSLKELYLYKNNLTNVPDFISNLFSLEKLNLAKNKIVNIPESIGNLSSLTELNLEDNELIKLPTSINGLKLLQKLDIRYNNMKNVPDSIGELSSEEYLKGQLKYLNPNNIIVMGVFLFFLGAILSIFYRYDINLFNRLYYIPLLMFFIIIISVILVYIIGDIIKLLKIWKRK